MQLVAANVTPPMQWATILIGAILCAGGVAWFVSELLKIVYRESDSHAQSWDFDNTRRIRLRKGSAIYRWFEPLITEIQDASILHSLAGPKAIDLALRQGGATLPWKTQEFIGWAAMQGIVAGTIAALIVWQATGVPLAIVVAPGLATLVFIHQIKTLKRNAAIRIRRFRQRLPFTVDLIALMLEAGGDMRQCLETVVQENQKHPIGEEFGRLLHDVRCGISLVNSFAQLQERLRDKDFAEIVFSIRSAEELGTPLGTTFLNLAEQMRLKRSQNAERLVGEATAMLPFANLVIMIAGLMVVVAPYLLRMFLDSPF